MKKFNKFSVALMSSLLMLVCVSNGITARVDTDYQLALHLATCVDTFIIGALVIIFIGKSIIDINRKKGILKSLAMNLFELAIVYLALHALVYHMLETRLLLHMYKILFN